MSDFPRLMTAEEAALCLRIRPSRLYELVRRGVVPAIHLGRQVRFNPEELRRFIGSAPTDEPSL